MIYEKAMAEVVFFDNSDVITKSGCGNGNNGNQGSNCTGDNVTNQYDCSKNQDVQHDSSKVNSAMWDAGWLD